MIPSALLDALVNCPGRDGRLLFEGDQLLQANSVGLRTFRAPGCRRGERWVSWLERHLQQFRDGNRSRWRGCYQRPLQERILEYRVEFRRLPDSAMTLVCSTLTHQLDLHQPLPFALDATQAQSLTLLLDSTLVGKLLLAQDGQVLYANAFAGSLFGQTPDQLRGQYLGLPLQIDQIVSLDLPVHGELRHAELSALQVPGSGAPTYLATLTDITERVRAQTALAQREEEYRQLADYYQLLAENASDLVCLVGHGNHLIWISPSVERLLGWSPQELFGQPLTCLFRPPTSEPDAPQQLIRCRHQNGSWRWMSASRQTVRDRADLHVGLLWTLRDVDELVQARNRTQEAERTLEATWNVQLDPHVIYEAVRSVDGTVVDFVFRHANPAACAYMGMSRELLLGARLLTLLPGLESIGLFADYVSVIHTDEPLILNDFTYDNEMLQDRRRYDLRAVRLGDSDSISVTWRDVTERYELSRRLSESEEHFRLLAENVSNVVLHLRRDRVAWVSPSLEQELGWTPEQWIGRPLPPLIHPDDRECYRETLAIVAEGNAHIGRGRLRGRDGRFHWVEAHCRTFLNARNQPDGMVATFRTVDDLVTAEAELSQRARFDTLTGLLNRSEIFERMQAMAAHPRRSGQDTALLFCDLDHFKAVNDRYGHAAGDALLQVVADRLQHSVRSQDLVARIGGDELLVVLVGVHSLEEAVAIAEKVRRAVALPVPWQDIRLSVSLSVGVTLLASDESIDALVARADTAMYQAKQQGRNRVVPMSLAPQSDASPSSSSPGPAPD